MMKELAAGQGRKMNPADAPYDEDYFEWMYPDIYFGVKLHILRLGLERVPEDLYISPIYALFWVAVNTPLSPPTECLKNPKAFECWLSQNGDIGEYILLCIRASNRHNEMGDPDSKCMYGLIDQIRILLILLKETMPYYDRN